MKKAFGSIDLLVSLLITALLFIIIMKTFNGVSSIKMNSSIDNKSIQEHVNKTVKEIEEIQQQTKSYEQTIYNY